MEAYLSIAVLRLANGSKSALCWCHHVLCHQKYQRLQAAYIAGYTSYGSLNFASFFFRNHSPPTALAFYITFHGIDLRNFLTIYLA